MYFRACMGQRVGLRCRLGAGHGMGPSTHPYMRGHCAHIHIRAVVVPPWGAQMGGRIQPLSPRLPLRAQQGLVDSSRKRHVAVCCLLRSLSACLACFSSSERLFLFGFFCFFFFFGEICSTAFPVQLSLFIGTGSGRLGRNYLSLGHAWCLAEHSTSLLHESC